MQLARDFLPSITKSSLPEHDPNALSGAEALWELQVPVDENCVDEEHCMQL